MARKTSQASPGDTQAEPTFQPPLGGYAVRMYRQGLGDCFLVALSQGKGKRPFYLLFDCGIHARQDDGTMRLLEVMEDLVDATGGSIDVVVVTHQHADHVSGFVQKGNPFVDGRIKVGMLWVGWTEKRGDPRADELRKKHGAAREALDAAIEKLKQREGTGLANRLNSLLDFEKVEEEPDPRVMKAAKLKPGRKARAARSAGEGGDGTDSRPKRVSSTELAVEFLASAAGDVHYCEPGEALPLGKNGDARRAYVLGPPRGDLLKRDLPTGGDESERRETYLAGGSGQRTFLLSPGLGAAGKSWSDGSIPDDLCHPFDYSLRRSFVEPEKSADPIKWNDATIPPETRKFYNSRYFDNKEEDWRRIDGDWLGAAEQLALNLDSDTNNTSLVLALEFGKPGEGKVALFVGDAQVGNWLSWADQKYKVGSHTATIDELFERTHFYKVGHHGSHNATLKRDSRRPTAADKFGSPYGLELMRSPLIAMIPVDRAAAEKKMPIAWHMPHPPLYETLLSKTAGRVLRADGLPPEKGIKGPEAVGPTKEDQWDKVPGVPNASWREAPTSFSKGENTRKCPLYYDVKFEL